MFLVGLNSYHFSELGTLNTVLTDPTVHSLSSS